MRIPCRDEPGLDKALNEFIEAVRMLKSHYDAFLYAIQNKNSIETMASKEKCGKSKINRQK